MFHLVHKTDETTVKRWLDQGEAAVREGETGLFTNRYLVSEILHSLRGNQTVVSALYTTPMPAEHAASCVSSALVDDDAATPPADGRDIFFNNISPSLIDDVLYRLIQS